MPNLIVSITAATLVVILAAGTGCSTVSPAESARRAVEALHEKDISPSVGAKEREEVPAPRPDLDWDLPEGHFFTQTNGRPAGTSMTGFAVTNQGGVLFWQRFQELGGVRALGYPVSRRFTWLGSPTQVFQRGVLQWDRTSGQVLPLNILDVLSNTGKDEWLRRHHATPSPLPADFDKAKPWKRIVDDRLALLKGVPAIEQYYGRAYDPAALYGLPTSRPEDFGEHVTVRFQRAVIREWKVDRMGFKAGELVVENVGEWAIEAGLFPPEALEPESAPPAPTGEPGTRSGNTAAATGTPGPGFRDTPTAPRQMRVGNTQGTGVYVRRTPRMEDKLRAWPDNTIMEAIGETAESEGRTWIRVRDPAGNLGWVPEEYLIAGPR